MQHIHILGAGLVGSLLSIYLARRGYQVHLYERRPDFRRADYIGGRSINLAMSDRGLKGLGGVDLAEKVKSVGIPMYRRVMHDTQGNLTSQPYGKDNQCIYAVSRGNLNKFLLDEAEKYNNIHVTFEQRCLDIDLKKSLIYLENTQSKQQKNVEADVILGADGAFSAVRYALQKTDRFDYSQQYLAHSYKELTIPPTATGEFAMEVNALHIWPRGGFMLIALPNLDKTFTCTLFLATEGGSPSFADLKSKENVVAFFQQYFPDAVALMPDFVEQFFENPTSSLLTVKAKPWVYGDNIALIGDAAHAIVPFYGQGMNAGFEDCYELDQLLTQYQDHWATTLQAYQMARIDNANAIADLALMNFVEMRDLVGKPEFLLRKKIEAKLNELYPQDWIPLYTMVTFSPNLPYKEALRLGKIQDSIMAKVMALPHLAENWQSLNFEKIIAEYRQLSVISE